MPIDRPTAATPSPATSAAPGAVEQGLSYASAGVDIDAGNALVEAIKPLARATRRPGADGALGGFGGLFDLKAAGFQDPILVAANDGVGTKLRIAIDTGLHDTIGIDLVAMCVNDLVVQGAEPLFFLDYYATGQLQVEVARAVVAGIAEGCRIAGAALIGGETAEMPGLYGAGDYDLAGFAVGAAERGRLLPRDDIEIGDVLVALPSSGVHSNGFSLVRKIVERSGLDWADEAPFAAGSTLGAALLTPTRIYARALLETIRVTGAVKALAHVTGGGLIENIPRVLPPHLAVEIGLGAWTPPPVFGWLSRMGGVSESEMLRTFNCGIGMVAVIAADQLGAVNSMLTTAGEKPFAIGCVVSRAADTDAGVRFSGTLNLSS